VALGYTGQMPLPTELAGGNGLLVEHATAVLEDPGLNLTVDSCVYHDSRYDMLLLLHAVPMSTQPSTLCGTTE